ncbi:Lumazine-binding protein [Gloeothece citriformis PCC 7424]|uniref:Lumazine-binding protein n=1 Tax=Gloeothece citriformis (strain PCC 7424) TaxID=65393 RepID=B7KGP8_GLOC7|nr:Lumazine-binding protein [Gloeothece citriformis]ACK71975.1 Lumazine-binding protein [Gloeothece citriformis PCC 7424]
MFTGIIKETGLIEQINPIPSGYEVTVNVSSALFDDLSPQASIALNGKALTLIDKFNFNDQLYLRFYLHSEAGFLPNTRVNLERAVRLGEEVSSSLFFGIPSGKCQLISLTHEADNLIAWQLIWNHDLVKYLDRKDLICLDGVLLIIKEINHNLLFFSIYKETLTITNLGDRKIGDYLTIEIDPMIKKIAQILAKKML